MRMPAEEKQMTPFVGPRPIGRGELLFGRDREVRDLIDLLASSRIVLLHSPSGAGKSSLINAGLIPALEAERFHILNVIRVSKELPSLPAQRGIPTEVNRYVLGALLSLEEGFLGAERMDPSNLALLSLDEYLQIREASLDPQDAVILILDQFEEILTLDPIDLKAKAGFFEQLGKALVNRRRWALFAMREDYVGSLDPFLQPLPTQLSVRMRLDLLSEQAARDAIRRPRREERLPPDAAEEVLTRVPSGVTLTENFTEEAAIKLAEDLARMLIQQPDGSRKPVPGPYVEPVQLQVVCERLWSQRPEGATQIDVDALQEVGTVDDALAGYYADKVVAIARDPATVPARVPAGDFARDCALGVDEWRIRDWFDRKLITAEGIRSQVMRGASQSEGLANEAIECLMRAYLVRQERRRGVTWYELAHDRLVDPILGDNKRWRMQHLSPYYARAARWASEKPNPPDLLLRGSELDDMERWQRERGGRLTDDEEAFLEASQEAHGLRQVRRSREAERRTNLAETGWGVILADPALREPLAELLDRRRAQAADRNPAYYQEFSYLRADGARPAETARQFLARHGIGTGAFEPDRVPYYLLIAGDPDVIPFEFQYELDLQYAVGRISFDTPEEYAAYARSVVTAETGGVALSPSAAFFSPQHPGDRTTEIIVNSLVVPTTERLQKARLQPPWEIQPVLREEATKARLGRLLGGPDTPALLVAVGHGLQFPPDDDRHVVAQGAFLCQDWPGPQAWQGPLPPGFYFSAEDVPGDAQLLGLMAFFSASHSAGTPPGDDFAHQQTKKPGPPVRPFVARLAQRLLGHPQGGALAVCGHVDVPWLTEGPVAAVPIFAEVIRRLMDGHTVGSAMEVFDQRYAVFAARASEILRRQMALAKGDQAAPSDWELTTLLTAMVDARNYVIVGDPAVRLPVVEASLAAPRPLLRPVSVPPPPVKLPLPEPLPLEPSRHLAGVHAAFVDLEIDLTRRGAEGYGVAMRLTQSGSDVEVLMASADKTRVQIDVQDLVPSGPPAVSPGGQRLTESLFADPAVRDGFLQARANAQTRASRCAYGSIWTRARPS